MEAWLVNLGIVSIGSVLGLVLVFKIVRLERMHLFLARLLLRHRENRTYVNAALQYCEAAVLRQPSCVEQIALFNYNLTPQELAALYVCAADTLGFSDPLSQVYYTEALRLDPDSAADICCKRAVTQRELKAQWEDYKRATELYEQQGRQSEAKFAGKRAAQIFRDYQISLKPDIFQPVSGKIFDAQSWQPLNDEQVLVITGTRLVETIAGDPSPQPSPESADVTIELHWRAYSVPVPAISEGDEVGFIGYFLYQGQRLKIDEDITSERTTDFSETTRHYQATELDLFCFNFLLEVWRECDWQGAKASLRRLQLTWEQASQAWILSPSNERLRYYGNYSIHTATVRFDFQNLRAYYRAESSENYCTFGF